MTLLRDPANLSVGTLVHQLIDDGRAYAAAEIDVLRVTATARVRTARSAIVMGVAAIFIAQAGLTVLVVALGVMLAWFVGPGWGMLIAALLALGIAGAMLRYAVTHISPAAVVPAPDAGKGDAS